MSAMQRMRDGIRVPWKKIFGWILIALVLLALLCMLYAQGGWGAVIQLLASSLGAGVLFAAVYLISG